MRIPGFLVLTLFVALPLPAQIKLPPNPNQFTKRTPGESGGGGTSVGVSGGESSAAASAVVVQYVAVTPVEDWANTEGKVMQARLLAFSAPEAGQSGPVEIVRGGKVRFLVTGRKDPIDFPLERLDEAARTKIQALAEMAAKGPPAQD